MSDIPRGVRRVWQYENHHPDCCIEHTIDGPCLYWSDAQQMLTSLGYQDTRNQNSVIYQQPERPA